VKTVIVELEELDMVYQEDLVAVNSVGCSEKCEDACKKSVSFICDDIALAGNVKEPIL